MVINHSASQRQALRTPLIRLRQLALSYMYPRCAALYYDDSSRVLFDNNRLMQLIRFFDSEDLRIDQQTCKLAQWFNDNIHRQPWQITSALHLESKGAHSVTDMYELNSKKVLLRREQSSSQRAMMWEPKNIMANVWMLTLLVFEFVQSELSTFVRRRADNCGKSLASARPVPIEVQSHESCCSMLGSRLGAIHSCDWTFGSLRCFLVVLVETSD